MSRELEIKVLDVNIKEMESKLLKLGCKSSKPVIQKLYVFDVFSISALYNSIIVDWNVKEFKDVVISRIKQLLLELNSIINFDDSKKICKIFDVNSLNDYIKKVEYTIEMYEILKSDEVKDIILKYNVNSNKWIRVRQTGDDVTITIKHILKDYNEKSNQYDISDVEEYEMKVESIESAKSILEQLGFYHRNYQEKQRISFYYKPLNVSIEIDSWPLIPPYIEIEGETESEIYEMVELLGYKKTDTIVANTSKVYEMYGINIYDYKELKF